MDDPVQVKSFSTKAGEPLRFVEGVALSYEGDDCLIWPFGRSTSGYGVLTLDDGKSVRTSRYVCERAKGPPPSDDHDAAFTCHNGDAGCVNPRHLLWRTFAEIAETMIAEDRMAKGTQMPHAKLDEQKVRAIRQAADTMTRTDLAKMYGVCAATITHVISRKKWAWVTD